MPENDSVILIANEMVRTFETHGAGDIPDCSQEPLLGTRTDMNEVAVPVA
jgi:hypothetical protein